MNSAEKKLKNGFLRNTNRSRMEGVEGKKRTMCVIQNNRVFLPMCKKVAVDAMFSELRSRKSVSRLCLYENAENCVVDFGDVAVGGALGRYCIAKKLAGEFAEYLLTLYLYHEGVMFRLIASGEEKGDSSLRRLDPEHAYRKVSAEAFGSETIVAGVSLIDDMPREECCYCLGEDPFYDDLYPEHPLTQLRLLVKSVVRKVGAKEAA